MIKHDVIGLYVTLSGPKRIDFLISHYPDFDKYIASYKEYVKDTMLDILSSNRSSATELGVRVQTSGGNQDTTFSLAEGRLAIDKCFDTVRASRKMFPDADDYELVSMGLYEWERLQREFSKLNATINMILNEEEQKIIKAYFRHDKRLHDLAQDLCIEMESANKRVYRIRKKLVNSIGPWFEENTIKASA